MSWHTVANQRGLKKPRRPRRPRRSILIRSRIKGKGRAVDPDRRSLQPSKKNIQHFKKWNLVTFYVCESFLPYWIRIRIANPGTPLNPDPDPQHWGKAWNSLHRKTLLSRVADSDPNWIKAQSCQWIRIRIRNPDPYPDPGGQKWPIKVEKI